MRSFIFCFIAVFLIPIYSVAQYNYSTSNKKAIKSYEEALQSFNRMDYTIAIDLMQKAIKYDNKFIEAHIVLAEIFIEKGDRINAILFFKNAISIDSEFYAGIYFSLAQLEMLGNDFESAKLYLEKYLSYKNLKPISISQAKRKLESCSFAIEAIKNPVPFNPINLGENINTEYDEYWPTLTADEQTLIITRLIPRDLETDSKQNTENVLEKEKTPANQNKPPNFNEVHEDFYISVKDNGFWSKAINAGKPLNTNGNEGAQTILVDGRVMYFTACNRKDGKGRCDIYQSLKEKGEWNTAVNIGAPVNSEYWEAQPSISPDGKSLFFVSNRDGGSGQKDIWMSNIMEDGRWSKPINLGENVNSAGQEQSPFIHPDNKTLYFASDGKIGMGGFDLYKASRNDDGTWSKAINLGYPINTASDEIGLIVNAQGNRAFFSSDRLNDKGRDIFEFELYKEARPNPVSYIKGNVFDSENKNRLKANFELISLETNEIIMQAESDPNSGEFLVCIPSDNDYALNVSKDKYLFFSDNFSLKGQHDILNPFLKDVALNPIKPGQRIVLKNIFYATDSYELIDKSIAELTILFEFMNKNAGLKIEISGHTDNTGNSEYNLNLSNNRAKSVYNYLIKNGIPVERLSYIGYGESQPLSSNKTEFGKAENRRTEIKITSSN
ncbi:MAG: OmpA family protein [Bacteroidales bacterium]|jgi:outer membrane protein OmpA-like peptidoglycan-associated protein/tetratricopeptide (TPR) repeat protein|nr:OmpA family protein [Bacteroidales bacterium]